MARSFENLVALANHQERLREARKMMWRDKGEPVTELSDLWECAEHAARGGMSKAYLCPRTLDDLLKSMPQEQQPWDLHSERA